ncbi:MAG: SOS response-associated peptidase [Patescibacteria group bacterium]
MCSHYDPLTDPVRFRAHFGVSDVPPGLKASLWPGYQGPYVRRHEFADVGDEAVPERELIVGSFGLIPHWAKDATIARRTYNARSETVHEKPSFRDAWKAGRFCLIPAEAIYEPDWRSGKAVATRISRADGRPMGIAGIWSVWKSPEGARTFSYSMLTVNADVHPFMNRYHKPDDEKRMVAILDEAEYGAWLSCRPSDARDFLRQFPADRLTSAA